MDAWGKAISIGHVGYEMHIFHNIHFFFKLSNKNTANKKVNQLIYGILTWFSRPPLDLHDCDP